MGVRGFRAWFESQFPDALSLIHTPLPSKGGDRDNNDKNSGGQQHSKQQQQQHHYSFDHVLLDLNPLIHNAVRYAKNDDHALLLLMRELDRLIRDVARPVHSLVIAMDGAPSAAKVATQRSRRRNLLSKSLWKQSHLDRYYKGKITTKQMKKLQLKYANLSELLQLTPGTDFMKRVEYLIWYWSYQRLSNPTNFLSSTSMKKKGSVKIYFSSSNVADEGEVKLLDWIHMILKQDEMNKNKILHSNHTIALIGGDSDLVLESWVIPTKAPHNIFVVLPTSHSKENFMVITIWNIYKQMMEEYLKGLLPSSQLMYVRTDMVLLLILNGNDYLPKLRGSSGFHRIFQVYLSCMKKRLKKMNKMNVRIEDIPDDYLFLLNPNTLKFHTNFSIEFFNRLALTSSSPYTYSREEREQILEEDRNLPLLDELSSLSASGILVPKTMSFEIIGAKRKMIKKKEQETEMESSSTTVGDDDDDDDDDEDLLDDDDDDDEVLLDDDEVLLDDDDDDIMMEEDEDGQFEAFGAYDDDDDLEDDDDDDDEEELDSVTSTMSSSSPKEEESSSSEEVSGNVHLNQDDDDTNSDNGDKVLVRLTLGDAKKSPSKVRTYQIWFSRYKKLKFAKEQLAEIALKDIMGNDYVQDTTDRRRDSLILKYDWEVTSTSLVPPNIELYLSGLLWNIQTYQEGKCANFAYDYGRRQAPSAMDIVKYFENINENKDKPQPSLLQDYVEPVSAEIACLAAIPSTEAHELLPMPYAAVLSGETIDNFYGQCMDKIDNRFDAKKFETLCNDAVGEYYSTSSSDVTWNNNNDNNMDQQQTYNDGRRRIRSKSKHNYNFVWESDSTSWKTFQRTTPRAAGSKQWEEQDDDNGITTFMVPRNGPPNPAPNRLSDLRPNRYIQICSESFPTMSSSSKQQGEPQQQRPHSRRNNNQRVTGKFTDMKSILTPPSSSSSAGKKTKKKEATTLLRIEDVPYKTIRSCREGGEDEQEQSKGLGQQRRRKIITTAKTTTKKSRSYSSFRKIDSSEPEQKQQQRQHQTKSSPKTTTTNAIWSNEKTPVVEQQRDTTTSTNKKTLSSTEQQQEKLQQRNPDDDDFKEYIKKGVNVSGQSAVDILELLRATKKIRLEWDSIMPSTSTFATTIRSSNGQSSSPTFELMQIRAVVVNDDDMKDGRKAKSTQWTVFELDRNYHSGSKVKTKKVLAAQVLDVFIPDWRNMKYAEIRNKLSSSSSSPVRDDEHPNDVTKQKGDHRDGKEGVGTTSSTSVMSNISTTVNGSQQIQDSSTDNGASVTPLELLNELSQNGVIDNIDWKVKTPSSSTDPKEGGQDQRMIRLQISRTMEDGSSPTTLMHECVHGSGKVKIQTAKQQLAKQVLDELFGKGKWEGLTSRRILETFKKGGSINNTKNVAADTKSKKPRK